MSCTSEGCDKNFEAVKCQRGLPLIVERHLVPSGDIVPYSPGPTLIVHVIEPVQTLGRAESNLLSLVAVVKDV